VKRWRTIQKGGKGGGWRIRKGRKIRQKRGKNVYARGGEDRETGRMGTPSEGGRGPARRDRGLASNKGLRGSQLQCGKLGSPKKRVETRKENAKPPTQIEMTSNRPRRGGSTQETGEGKMEKRRNIWEMGREGN